MGLVSRQRGQVSPRRLGMAKRTQIEALLRGKCPDFGAILAAEKPGACEGSSVSRETVRRIQIDLELARARRRSARVHSTRERRPRFGELIQIDGSPHDWLEGCGPHCTLIVLIDDATGRLTALHFAPAETTKVYLAAQRAHVLAHGVPLAFYSDRHGIFRVNAKETASGDGHMEFGRVAERLRVELIQATTPQAKGRVERANQTLQDRLIKEMRLAGICDIDGAQAFAQAFIKTRNSRFARAPLDAADAHQPWTQDECALDEAFARRGERTLSKALTFSAGGNIHCVRTHGPGTVRRGARVTLLHFQDGTMRVDYKNRSLPYNHFRTSRGPDPVKDEKTLDARMMSIVSANPASRPDQASGQQGRG